MADSSQPITSLLHRMRQGDRDAGNLAMQAVYSEMHRLAGRFMRRESPGHTLQPTALVNEAYVRLSQGEAADPKDRQHFVAIAATVMRRILVDHAREKQTDKRGAGAHKVQLEDVALAAPAGTDLVELDEMLDQLAAVDARAANAALVGLLRETAGRLGATPAQVALAWLLAQRPWIVPIPGTRHVARLAENLGAAALDLAPDDLAAFDRAARAIPIEGARYPAELEARTGL